MHTYIIYMHIHDIYIIFKSMLTPAAKAYPIAGLHSCLTSPLLSDTLSLGMFTKEWRKDTGPDRRVLSLLCMSCLDIPYW